MIALTHMRWPNDELLAREVDGIDLVLGGHDHDYGVKQVTTGVCSFSYTVCIRRAMYSGNNH